MAEYFPLLERAVSGLQGSSPQARQAIYERARTALLGQLRAMDPPVPDEDINRENEALDDAIRRVEAQFATPPSPAAEAPIVTPAAVRPQRPRAPTATEPGASQRSEGAPAATPPARERPVFTPRPAGGTGSAMPRPAPSSVRPRLGTDPERARSPSPLRPSAPARAAPVLRPSGAPSQTEAPANSPPTESLGVVAPDPRDAPGTLPVAPRLEVPERAEPPLESDLSAGNDGQSLRARLNIRPAAPTLAEPPRRGRVFYAVMALLVLVAAGIAVAAYELRDKPGQITAAPSTPTVGAPESPNKLAGRADGSDTGEPAQPDAGASGAAASAPDAAAEQAPPPPAAATAGSPASTAETGTTGTAAIGVSQRAALLVDAPEDPQKVKTYEGSVVWREGNVSPGQDQPLLTAVEADVDIPDAKLSMTMTLKKNTEPQLPASYTVEFQFTPKPGNTLGPVKQINVPEMRQNDSAPTGDPLVGLTASITEDHFLVGLSQGDAKATNTALLLQRNWVDMSVLFASGKVGKITFEKGSTGQHIIEDAMKSWQ